MSSNAGEGLESRQAIQVGKSALNRMIRHWGFMVHLSRSWFNDWLAVKQGSIRGFPTNSDFWALMHWESRVAYGTESICLSKGDLGRPSKRRSATKLSEIRTQVLVAVFFQSAMATVYVCIAAMFYPILRKFRAGLAIGYFGFRIIGAAFLFVGIGSLMLLLSLSQAFVSAGQVNAPYFQATGELLRTGRDIMNHIGMILPWMSGSLILYYCMFKMKLVPNWLSIWGLIGSSLTIAATLLFMLDFIEMFTPTYMMMNIPSALFELSLAVYLIVKGVNASVADNHRADARRAYAK